MYVTAIKAGQTSQGLVPSCIRALRKTNYHLQNSVSWMFVMQINFFAEPTRLPQSSDFQYMELLSPKRVFTVCSYYPSPTGRKRQGPKTEIIAKLHYWITQFKGFYWLNLWVIMVYEPSYHALQKSLFYFSVVASRLVGYLQSRIQRALVK